MRIITYGDYMDAKPTLDARDCNNTEMTVTCVSE